MIIKKIKVVTIVGTRPEIIRLSRVIAKLDLSPAIEHIIVHTGQNYDFELNQIFFDDMNIRKPNFFLDAAGKNANQTIGQILIKIDDVFDELLPDAILILGDTNSCLCAIPAKKRKIPIFHMEAGNRCFDQRVPEETNRKIVDHISDINLSYSDIARENLLREGLPADRCIKIGSPMMEILNHYRSKIDSSSILQQLNLEKNKYFLVSCHREENVNNDNNFAKFILILNQLAEIYRMPIIVSTHPRTKIVIESKDSILSARVQLMKPMGFSDYNHLQINAKAVLSDSGTISEETSILGLSSLNIREAHERQEAMEETAVMMTGLNPERILQGLAQLDSEREEKAIFEKVRDYSILNVSDKMVRIIISYCDYVNRVVWSK